MGTSCLLPGLKREELLSVSNSIEARDLGQAMSKTCAIFMGTINVIITLSIGEIGGIVGDGAVSRFVVEYVGLPVTEHGARAKRNQSSHEELFGIRTQARSFSKVPSSSNHENI